MENKRYPLQCYKMLKNVDDVGRNTWASSVKQLLFSLGFGYVWIAQDVGNSVLFIKSFQLRLKDIYKQNWEESLNSCSKADTYRCYKSLLTPEKYLFINLPYEFKQILSKFRSSTHVLMIEKGRHEGLERNR